MRGVNELGYHSSCPMDILHTISNGLMNLIKVALFHFAGMLHFTFVVSMHLIWKIIMHLTCVQNLHFNFAVSMMHLI